MRKNLGKGDVIPFKSSRQRKAVMAKLKANPFSCPPGTSILFRFRKTTKPGEQIRLAGCARKGRFVRVKEVCKFLKGKKVSCVKI